MLDEIRIQVIVKGRRGRDNKGGGGILSRKTF